MNKGGDLTQESNPLVSIVIPVYNGANYMREAIDSALNQTYSNIEIILVNDGSTDSTEEIALSYGADIKYFYQQNGGQSAALNRGVREMNGQIFCWLSHDDVYHEEKVAQQINKYREYEFSPNVFIYTDYTVIDENGSEVSIVHHDNMTTRNYIYLLLMGKAINGCTIMIHKDCIVMHGLFNLNRPHTSDVELFLRIGLGNTPLRIAQTLVKSRVHAGQATRKHSKYHTYETNQFGIDALRIAPVNVLKASAAELDVATPYVSLAKRWSYMGRWKASKEAQEYARKYELSGLNKCRIKFYCLSLFFYGKLRRTVAEALRT